MKKTRKFLDAPRFEPWAAQETSRLALTVFVVLFEFFYRAGYTLAGLVV